MRSLMIPLAAIATVGALPAVAQPHDRQYVDRRELNRDHDRVNQERREYNQALAYGDRRDVKQERRDYDRAQRELRQDARDWQRGRNYSYTRPDPRYGGYYADNYYRAGNYRPYRLSSNDRVYRGRDNRYYCRRNDGTTGLIVGALGGGVLGNVIAPGGSKTLGSLLGGGLGAVLGSSIDRNNVTCR